ncbi:ERI1 exoribonuclease 2 [Rhea pennata]|uniref:ERI1 exoribonuclease 2 n=1 Tax=Rhea pennata TaxID=8795 RepID=UPI002E2656F4
MATKRLARQLGLARSSAGARAAPGPAAGQRFGYVTVVDLEATCWRDAGRRRPETIEFPAVLLNTATGEIESEFHTYVQPQEHPILSEFCTELTGITQNQVDEGIPLNICLSQFLKWIQKIQKEKKILFNSDIPNHSTSEAKLCTFVTWTDWDLGVCLHYECKRKQLRKPDILNSWIDLKATYRLFYNRKPKGLKGALQDLGITFAGREHSGLDDSRNTAHLAWRMICDGCVLKVTKSLDKAHPKENLISRTPSINFTDKTSLGSNSRPVTSRETTRNISSPSEENHGSTTRVMINSKVQTEEQQEKSTVNFSADIHVVSSSSSRTDLHDQAQSSLTASADSFPLRLGQPQLSRCTGIQKGVNNGHLMSPAKYSTPVHGSGLVLVSTTISSVNVSDEDISTSSDCLSLLTDWEDVALIPESQYEHNLDYVQFKDDSTTISGVSALSSNLQSLGKTVVPVKPQKSIVYKSSDTTIYNVGMVQRQTSDFSAFKLPSSKVNATSFHSALTGNHSTPSEAPKRKPTSPKMYPPAKKQSFAIYTEKTESFNHSLPLRSSNLSKVSPAILNSTVNLNQSVRAAKNEKPTPPLCNCGRRAKRLYVSNTGPNHGKAFFCCPVGKHESSKKSCGYFKWEYAFLKEKSSNVLTVKADTLTSLGTSSNTLGNSSNKKYLCLRPSMRT